MGILLKAFLRRQRLRHNNSLQRNPCEMCLFSKNLHQDTLPPCYLPPSLFLSFSVPHSVCLGLKLYLNFCPSISLCLCSSLHLCLFFFSTASTAYGNSQARDRIKSELQLWPTPQLEQQQIINPLHWTRELTCITANQCQILNLLHHSGNSSASFSI